MQLGQFRACCTISVDRLGTKGIVVLNIPKLQRVFGMPRVASYQPKRLRAFPSVFVMFRLKVLQQACSIRPPISKEPKRFFTMRRNRMGKYRMAIRDDDQHAAARTIEYPTALMLPIAIDWFCPANSVVLMGRSQGRSLYVVVESSGGRQVSSLNACFP